MEVRSSQKTSSLDSCEGTCEPHTFMVGLCVVQTLECLSPAATHRRNPYHLAPLTPGVEPVGFYPAESVWDSQVAGKEELRSTFILERSVLGPPPPPHTHIPRVGVKSVDERGWCLGWKLLSRPPFARPVWLERSLV